MSNIIEDNSKIQKSIIKKYLSRLEKEYLDDIREKYDSYEEIAIIENNLNNKHNGNKN